MSFINEALREAKKTGHELVTDYIRGDLAYKLREGLIMAEQSPEEPDYGYQGLKKTLASLKQSAAKRGIDFAQVIQQTAQSLGWSGISSGEASAGLELFEAELEYGLPGENYDAAKFRQIEAEIEQRCQASGVDFGRVHTRVYTGTFLHPVGPIA